MLMPADPRDWLSAGHLAWKVIELAGVDLSRFGAWYRRDGQGGRPYDPAMMATLLLYCYCRGRRSSREIEMATYDDVGARVICGGLHPDHSTVAEFTRRPAGDPDAKVNTAGPASLVMPLKKGGFDQLHNVQALATARTKVILAILRHPSPVDVQALQPLMEQARKVLDAAGITGEILKALFDAGYASDANFTLDIPALLYIAVTREARQTGRSADGRAPKTMLPSWQDMTDRLDTPEGKELYRQRAATIEPVFSSPPASAAPCTTAAPWPTPSSPCGPPATTSSRPSPHAAGAPPARPAPPPRQRRPRPPPDHRTTTRQNRPQPGRQNKSAGGRAVGMPENRPPAPPSPRTPENKPENRGRQHQLTVKTTARSESPDSLVWVPKTLSFLRPGNVHEPAGCQNSAAAPDLVFYATRSYSLMRPPRTGRRLIRSLERSAAG